MKDDRQLSDRQKMILRAVVDLHITEGEPIGSKFLIEKRKIPYSSATVRNEMAALEAMGYLTHPHTSAGRIPSAMGYRFYVDSLMDDYDLTQSEIEELSDLVRGKAARLDDIMDRAAKLAGAMTNYSSMAFTGNIHSGVIKEFRIVLIPPMDILLVMIPPSGNAKTKQLRLLYSIDENTARKLENTLNKHLTSVTPDMINLPLLEKMEREMGKDAGIVAPVAKVIYSAMNDITEDEIRFDGISRLLQYPEFSDLDRFSSLLSKIENKDDIMKIVTGAENNDVNIYIGSENADSLLRTSTLVFKTIKSGGKVIGAIGVLGPRRMDYSKVITTVKVLSDQIEKMQDSNGNISVTNLLTDGEDGGNI